MTAAACSEIQIEQPPMVVRVHRWLDVIDGNRPDEALVEHERADEGRLQRSLGRHASRLEVGARARVDERTPICGRPNR